MFKYSEANDLPESNDFFGNHVICSLHTFSREVMSYKIANRYAQHALSAVTTSHKNATHSLKKSSLSDCLVRSNTVSILSFVNVTSS